jgi:hypothetical protein
MMVLDGDDEPKLCDQSVDTMAPLLAHGLDDVEKEG